MFQAIHKKIVSIAGCGTRITYRKVFSKKYNNRVLAPIGKEDVYAKIQTYKDDNNVYKLLERFNGDMTKLMQVQKGFEDLRNAPKSLNELNEQVSNYTNSFKTLPADLKQKFDNNPYIFIKNLGSENMNKILYDYYNKKGVPVDIAKTITPSYEPPTESDKPKQPDSIVNSDNGGTSNE